MPRETCYCHVLRKATRRLTAAYDAALEPAGINVAQFSLLRTFDRHRRLSLTELGRRMELDRSTIGRNIRVLERRGLVRAAPSADLREASFELADEGRRVLATALPLWAAVQERIEARFGAERTEALLAELGSIGAAGNAAALD